MVFGMGIGVDTFQLQDIRKQFLKKRFRVFFSGNKYGLKINGCSYVKNIFGVIYRREGRAKIQYSASWYSPMNENF
jgi:hypothetical protein